MSNIMKSKFYSRKTIKILNLFFNSPGLGPVGVSDHEHWVLISALSFFRIVFETFAIEANSSSQFRASFRFRIQTWTRLRATIRARAEIELEFELELLLLLRSAHARRRLQEPSDTGIVRSFHLGVPLFLKRFSEGFFSEKLCQMEPQMASKISQNLIKNELETKSTKNAGNMLNFIPLDLQETRFRMERLSKIMKTRSADKYKQI